MINILSIMLLYFLMPLNANAAMPSAESLANDSTNRQNSSRGKKSYGYSLATIPSVNRRKVESEFKKILPNIPDAKIIEKPEEKVVYRLVVQCFDGITPAKLLQARLLTSSKTPFVIHTDNLYCVVASSQMTKIAALAEQIHLADKQINANIVEVSLKLPHWHVNGGNFKELRDGVNMANTLSKKGMYLIIEKVDD